MERKIAVVGLGYVGLPLALALSNHFEVIGFDINKEKINSLNKGIDPTRENDLSLKANIRFVSDETELKKANFIIVAVPTPVTEAKHPNLTYLEKSSELVGRNLQRGAIVVYESTVYPGVTEEICLPILEKTSGLKLIDDFKIGYSPERINPGDKEHTIDKVVKIVSGIDKESLEEISKVYSKVTRAGIHKAKNIKTAEAAKVIENIQRDLNIALMNELSIIFDKIGIKTKDVLEAAGTKWNFHKYFPGLVGGHCFDKNEQIILINSGHLKTETIGGYTESKNFSGKKIRNTSIYTPDDVKILSFDVNKQESVFKKVKSFSKSYCENLIEVKTNTNQKITVTDMHPMLIYEDNEFKVKHAKDITIGDKIPIASGIPSINDKLKINIINHLVDYGKIRVKPIFGSFKDYSKKLNIKKLTSIKASNFYQGNYLPLAIYLKLEKAGVMPFSRDEIYLVTGRGPSFNKIKAQIDIDEDFCRLIGYYLSEGCITKDKSLRTRFVFNIKEKEYIEDLIKCIKKLSLKYSTSEREHDHATEIKVSSNIFGHIIKNVLKCGKDSYDAQIPEEIFLSKPELRWELLKGLFRGDGGVSSYNGKKAYKKNGKDYNHKLNTCEVSFFSISPKLFYQTVLLLKSFGITASYAKNRPLLVIHGHNNLKKMEDIFEGEKKQKIHDYFKYKNKFINRDKYEIHKGFFTVPVKEVKKLKGDYVYSVEVEDTNTVVSSYGIITHNCIPEDPYYLTHKAKLLGYHPNVILAGRSTNDNMSKHVASLVIKGLNKANKVIKNSRVIILGLTFKEDINDYRTSKALDVIKELKEYNIDVLGCEPNLSDEEVERIFGVKNYKLDEIKNNIDAIVLVNKHKQFYSLTADKLKSIMNQNPLIVDVKNLFNEEEVKKQGFLYYSL